MHSLKNAILEKLDNSSLAELSKEYPSMNADIGKEWRNRLLSADYLGVLKFFSENKTEKSRYIREGLYELRKIFPWRIGVIYNYNTGVVYDVQVKIGTQRNEIRTYTYAGAPILFSWLDVTASKKILHELVSNPSMESHLAEVVDEKISDKVRDSLLDYREVAIVLKKMETQYIPFRSFPLNASLSGGEDFMFSPFSINGILLENKDEEKGEEGDIVSGYFTQKVQVYYSPEIRLYLSVLSY